MALLNMLLALHSNSTWPDFPDAVLSELGMFEINVNLLMYENGNLQKHYQNLLSEKLNGIKPPNTISCPQPVVLS